MLNQPKSDCIYHFPVDLARMRRKYFLCARLIFKSMILNYGFNFYGLTLNGLQLYDLDFIRL